MASTDGSGPGFGDVHLPQAGRVHAASNGIRVMIKGKLPCTVWSLSPALWAGYPGGRTPGYPLGGGVRARDDSEGIA